MQKHSECMESKSQQVKWFTFYKENNGSEYM